MNEADRHRRRVLTLHKPAQTIRVSHNGRQKSRDILQRRCDLKFSKPSGQRHHLMNGRLVVRHVLQDEHPNGHRQTERGTQQALL